MKAYRIDRFGSVDGIVLRSSEDPRPAPKEILMRVRVSSLNRTYEFGGPQVYSFKVLLELLLNALNRQRILLPIPFALAEMQAGLLELLPNPPVTRDQVRLLKTDKVVSGMQPTLSDFEVDPGHATAGAAC